MENDVKVVSFGKQYETLDLWLKTEHPKVYYSMLTAIYIKQGLNGFIAVETKRPTKTGTKIKFVKPRDNAEFELFADCVESMASKLATDTFEEKELEQWIFS